MEAWLVGALCIGAVALFVWERIPPDAIALLVLSTLMLLQLVSPSEALSGFASPATITVGAMFVLSAGLRETGALRWLGQLLGVIGKNGPLLLVGTMLVAVGISSFINNTAAVAVLIPVVLAAAQRRGVSASKLLLPLSYAAQFGGVCTLIGTSTNLVVNSMAIQAGFAGFGLFDFAPVGLLLVAVGTTYLLLVGWWLLPNRKVAESLEDAYALREYVCAVTVPNGSRWVGRAPRQIGLGAHPRHALIEIVRGSQRLLPDASTEIAAGDELIFEGSVDALIELVHREGLAFSGSAHPQQLAPEGSGLHLAEVLIPPNSSLSGRELAELDAAWLPRCRVLALGRRGDVQRERLQLLTLRAGDVLLVLTDGATLQLLRDDPQVVVITARADPQLRRRRAPLSLAIVAAVVTVAATGWMPIEIAALLGGVAMVLARCIEPDRAYRAVDLRILVLLAGVLPLGIALEKSGAAAGLVDALMYLMPNNSPLVALALLYFATALLTEIISNNATAALMTPIALALATQLDVNAAPFLAAVAFAASTSFSTPIGYQTNTMVYGVGGYAFRDFLRVGVPLNLLFWAASVWAIPRWFPF